MIASLVEKVTLLVFGVAITLFASAAAADPTFLQRLDEETQALYSRAKVGLVRVYVPPPQWALDLMGRDFTIRRWDATANLGPNADVRDQVADAVARKYMEATMAPSAPSTQPGAGATTQPSADRGYRLVQRPDGSFDLVGGASTGGRAVIDVSPRSVGIVLDTQGHILIPYFIEKETATEQPLTVAAADGTVCAAKFVGSDAGTMLTVLQLERPAGEPVTLDGRRPQDGGLVLFLSITGEAARLQVWTGNQQETGVVLGVDGGVRGFLRQGQFLEAARVAPVVNQLIRDGHAKRKKVGVYIREVLNADPLRRENPALRDRPAVFIADVVRNSRADQAGLRGGDLLLKIGDETISDPPTFAAAITPFQNASAPLLILRDGKEMELTLKLGE